MTTATTNSGQVFHRFPANIAHNRLLREPQREGYEAVAAHFRESREPAVVQIPVGCGKTGLMAILPFGLARGRVLIVAPNVTIRETLFDAVDSASDNCFWRKMRAAPVTVEGPFAAKIDGADATLADCAESHFVVTNVQQVGTARSRWLGQFPDDFFDMILIDEGHHNAAASWRRLIERFPTAKTVSLTATPFRSDRKRVIGRRVYTYPFLRAMARGYIKSLHAMHVSPCELSFTFRDDSRECSLADVLELREEAWFSRGVALADQCNRHIVRASIERCEQLRRPKKTKHQIIAAACSVDHARQIAALYREAGYYAEELHSQQTAGEQDRVLGRLKNGRLDVIVQVQMLGEGFDHPPLSVAAIFRPFRSLSPYVQFVGRIMRVLRQGRPGDADNCGTVVSHVGLNTERHWREFRLLDDADQSLWAGLAGGEDDDNTPRAATNGDHGTKRFSPEMLVAWEVLGELHNCEYGRWTPQAEQTTFEGFTPADAVQATYAGPQQRRREGRSRLQQVANDTIRDVLARHRLPALGWEIGQNYRYLRRQNNWAALRYLFYCELNRELGRRPGTPWTLDEVETAIERAPRVNKRLAAKVQHSRRRNTSWRRYGSY